MLTDVTTMPTTDIPATTDPISNPTASDNDRYTDPTIPPMPPSPKAEPFHPATTVPASAIAPTPREQAFTLHLQGYRSPAIAAHLGVPERTIRYWIQTTTQQLNALPALDTLDTLDALADPLDPAAPEQPPTASDPTASTAPISAPLTTLQHQRTLAIERHRARSAAAWALHDQLRATLDPVLARLSERLLLHTQYPDDADPVSMATLALAGGPLTPAFRAMYHILPGIINGLTRSLALAERADLQIDRLQGITPSIPPAPKQPATSTPTSTPSTAKQQQPAEPMKPWPTREEINRAVQAERDAEDAIAASVFTERQLNIFRALACLPEKLPDGPIDTWNITFDPNAPISAWRLAVYPHMRHRAGRYAADDSDAPDDALDPAPASTSGKKIGNPGNASGNSGKKIGNAPGTHPPSISPHGPFPPREGGRGLGSGNPGNTSGNESGNPGNPTGNNARRTVPPRAGEGARGEAHPLAARVRDGRRPG